MRLNNILVLRLQQETDSYQSKRGWVFVFGEKLKYLRKERRYTQTELAGLLGIAPSTIGMYEQGRRQPDNNTLFKLSRLLNVTVDYLVSEETEQDGDKDIEEVISEIKSKLLSSGGLMFNGRPLSARELQKIADTVELSIKVLALDQEHKN